MKISKKEIFSIPNVLGYFRIALIPLFVYWYLNAQSTREYIRAGFVILVSGVTDLLDGKIARKFNMITELGKLIDPVADKLTHAAIIFCLLFKVKGFYLVVILFVGKELFMIIANIYTLKSKAKKLDGAIWWGKVMTTMLYICLYFFIAFPYMNTNIQAFLIIVCSLSIIVAWGMYIPVFKKLNQ